jgi:hypothetical protein
MNQIVVLISKMMFSILFGHWVLEEAKNLRQIKIDSNAL